MASKTNCFKIITVNVRGLRDLVKRTAVFSFLASSRYNVYFMQEVHLKDDRDVVLFKREWGLGESFWSVGGVHSSGVGILFADRAFVIEECFTVSQGRVLGVDATWHEIELRFICVYAQTTPALRALLFEDLAFFLTTNRYVVVGGDFNLDLGRVLEGRYDLSRRGLQGLLGKFALVDVFPKCCPGASGATWRNARGNSGLLDYFFVLA